jgi:hypothetical protein
MKTNELHFSGMQKSAKERKRVRKSVKRKGIVGGEWRRKGSPPITCMIVKRKDLQNGQSVND